MNKIELATAIAEKLNLPKKQVEDTLENLLSIIVSELKKGKEVSLTSFGTFSAKFRAARGGVNPRKPNERIQIPAVTVPKFKAGLGLKQALKHANGGKEEAPTEKPKEETPASGNATPAT